MKNANHDHDEDSATLVSRMQDFTTASEAWGLRRVRLHRILSATFLTCIGVMISYSVAAQSMTEKSVAKALFVIDAAVEAYGGEERLNNLGAIVISYETENIASGQSRAPGPPWDRNMSAGTTAISLDEQLFATRNYGSGGGFDFDGGTVVKGDESYQLDYRTGTATGIVSPDFDNLTGPFVRITPALLVRLAKQRSYTAHYLGSTKIKRKKHDVISFVMAVGPAISLYFDQQTHLLNRSERVLPGFGLVEYEFSNYESIDGVPFNRHFSLRVNNEPNMERKIHKTEFSSNIDRYLAVDDQLEILPAIGPDELSRQKLAEGVYLIGGNGTYAMFVEMSDYIVAVGGTAGIPDRIKSLREIIPNKPIKYGVMTHHHTDHIMGLTPYAEVGAQVLAASAHVESMKASVGPTVKLNIQAIDESKVLTDGQRELRIVDIGPTPHAEHFLLVYLPKEGIAFEADHFSMPRVGPVRPAVPSTIGFAAALVKHGIEPSIIASAHSPVLGSHELLKKALNTKAPKESGGQKSSMTESH